MSGERINVSDFGSYEEYLLYLKGKFLYKWCANKVAGNIVCLDFGCGDGYGSNILAQKIEQVVGFDTSDVTVKEAAGKYKRKNLKFVSSDTDYNLEDNSFDLVISLHVIEHIQNDEAFLRDCCRIINPGGFFFLATPNRTMRLKPRGKPWNVFHIREYECKELEQLLLKVFSQVQIYGLSARSDVLAIERARIKQCQTLAAWDVFNLRTKINPAILKWPIKFWHKIHQSSRKKTDYNENENLYFMQDSCDDNSLDIFALCRK